MTSRLVWNFEFLTHSDFILSDFKKEKEDKLKWEARFFWPESEIIFLPLLDPSMLELTYYQHKQKKDTYYLLKKNYNIKNRRNELIYKPLMKKGKQVSGFGPKINLSQLNPQDSLNKDVKKILLELKDSQEVLVKKESFTYKFPTQPHVKLELAKIELNALTFFTLCIEGKSRALVELITCALFGKKETEHYVDFLKKITQKC